ncbi:hypothetical protein DPX16_4367 [Anabarilius grahami]|uniref:Uncharacterized protein n=1 Tax=Anabarilius grahami TaxID=495550 RepID=A0A3N0Z559_ANAGA|nr:hypothetical protein DPX16_4367 [Anabarilius grahami]
MGFRILPPATMRERMARLRALMALRQEGWEVGCFAQTFWTMAVGLDYNDAALKEIFNRCLDDPLPQWEMEGLQILDFWRFTEYLHHRRQWATPGQSESSPALESAPEPAPARECAPKPASARESAPEPTEEVGTESPPHPRKRRKRRKKASFILQGPEASPEPVVGPETTLEAVLAQAPCLAGAAQALSSSSTALALGPDSRPTGTRLVSSTSTALALSPDSRPAGTPLVSSSSTALALSPDSRPAGTSLVSSSSTALAFSLDSRPAATRLVCSSGSPLAFSQGLWTWPTIPPPGPPPVHLPPESFVLCFVRWSVW